MPRLRLREVRVELVLTGTDAEVFQAAEGILDEVATAVSLFVLANGSLPVAAPRNDGDSAGLTENGASYQDRSLYYRVGIACGLHVEESWHDFCRSR